MHSFTVRLLRPLRRTRRLLLRNKKSLPKSGGFFMPGMLEKLLDQLARVNVMSGISLKVPLLTGKPAQKPAPWET